MPLLSHELVVDSFAGGGGASLGIEWALGRAPDVAINHDPEALALHRANHPGSHHYCQNVWEVDPVEACAGRPVGLMWLSPDCTHFSKAKGGKPVSKKIRSLAWVAVRWAAAVRPRVIVLENVEEFQTWGPVSRETRMPCPRRRGQTFRRFVSRLRRHGYQVEWRELRACDFGAPTIRKRLFLVARCDGEPIQWPAPTHGKGRPQPWRTAAECIDWSIPCPSIFERARPLAAATCRRIAHGVMRYVVKAPRPFLVSYYGTKSPGGERTAVLEAPLPTQPTENRFGLVVPSIIPIDHASSGASGARSAGEPLTTITAEARHALVAPTLIQTGYGEREGQAPRVPGLDKPLGTAVAGGAKHAVVAAFLAKHYGGVVGTTVDGPAATVTAKDHHALVASSLVKYYGTNIGQPADAPLGTVTAGGEKFAEVRAFLTAYYGSEKDGAALTDPMRTVTARDRMGLVTVHGETYAIADIGMRMLAPRELYRAQGFPDSYRIDVQFNGKPLSKTAQVRMCGNSVCPPMAKAIVAANLGAPAAVETERDLFSAVA